MAGPMLLGTFDLVWWVVVRLVKLAVPVAVAAGWSVFVVASGRTWRHQVRRRLVTRPVRAAGNWVVIAAVAGLIWQPVVTAVVLAVAGGSLVTAALLSRHRTGQQQLDQRPIRVKATVGAPVRALTADTREEVNDMGETPEETAAWDAATVAILRGLERNGHDRTVLADMSPADLKKVFDAEARHARRVRGR